MPLARGIALADEVDHLHTQIAWRRRCPTTVPRRRQTSAPTKIAMGASPSQPEGRRRPDWPEPDDSANTSRSSLSMPGDQATKVEGSTMVHLSPTCEAGGAESGGASVCKCCLFAIPHMTWAERHHVAALMRNWPKSSQNGYGPLRYTSVLYRPGCPSPFPGAGTGVLYRRPAELKLGKRKQNRPYFRENLGPLQARVSEPLSRRRNRRPLQAALSP